MRHKTGGVVVDCDYSSCATCMFCVDFHQVDWLKEGDGSRCIYRAAVTSTGKEEGGNTK